MVLNLVGDVLKLPLSGSTRCNICPQVLSHVVDPSEPCVLNNIFSGHVVHILEEENLSLLIVILLSWCPKKLVKTLHDTMCLFDRSLCKKKKIDSKKKMQNCRP